MALDRSALNHLSRQVVDAGFLVHSELGPGCLESAYRACLVYELRTRGLLVDIEVPVPVTYRGVRLEQIGFRIDLLVEKEIVLELKACEGTAAVHLAQLVSYLRLADKRLGFLMNFHVDLLKNGIHRRVNGF